MDRHFRQNDLRRRLVAVLLLVSCLPCPAAAEDAVAALRRALGVGSANTGAVLRIEAEGSDYSRDYNIVPLGTPQHLSDDRTTTLWQPASGAFLYRVERAAWHPYAEDFAFAEAFDGEFASRTGPHDFRPGDDGALAAPYVGALHKRLLLGHPRVLVGLAESLRPGEEPGEFVARLAGTTWRIEVDPQSGLPRAVEVEEEDDLFGSVPARADYADWRRVDGVMTPFRVRFTADGVLERRESRLAVEIAEDLDPAVFRLAGNLPAADPARIAAGFARAHLINHRSSMARPTELRPAPPAMIDELGDGLFLLGGVAHNSLVIEGARELVLVEAPVDPARGRAILDTLAARFPDKKVGHLVLTHHHIDHSAGFAPVLRSGATLHVGTAGLALYREAARRTGIEAARILPAEGRRPIAGFDRPVELIEVPNSHADGMIVVLVPDAGLLFVTDLYSPGRARQHPRMSAEFFSALRFEGFGPLRLVGGHGQGSEDWTP